jgi:hypothetical protein
MNIKLSTNFTINSLQRALNPAAVGKQEKSKINSSTRSWLLYAFGIKVGDKEKIDAFDKTSFLKVADYKHKPSTALFKVLFGIITLSLSEVFFRINDRNQYLDKTTAFISIIDDIAAAFMNMQVGEKLIKFDIELDGVKKNVTLIQNQNSVSILIHKTGDDKYSFGYAEIINCSLFDINKAITSKSINLDDFKDKFRDRIECNKLSKKYKVEYSKLSNACKIEYSKLSKKDKYVYINLITRKAPVYGNLSETKKIEFSELIKEYRLSLDNLDTSLSNWEYYAMRGGINYKYNKKIQELFYDNEVDNQK